MRKDEFLKYCEAKSPGELKPLIPFVIEVAEKLSDITYSQADLAKVIMYAGNLRDSIGIMKMPEEFSMFLKSNPESIITSKELVKKILPNVERIRFEIFGDFKSPFPDDLDNAIDWLKKEAEKDALSMKLANQDNLEEVDVLYKRIDYLIRELSEKSLSQEFMFGRSWLKLAYQDKDGSKKEIQIYKGTTLAKLRNRTKNLVEKTYFTPESLVTFILTGIKPYLPCLRLIQKKFGKVQIDLYRGLEYNEFLALHQIIKKLLKQGKKSLKEKQEDIHDLVESYGGVPKKGKMKFWDEIWKEWKRRYPHDEYASADCLRIGYNRIMNRIKIDN